MKKTKSKMPFIQKIQAFKAFTAILFMFSLLFSQNIQGQEVESEEYYKKWFENLYDPGVIMTKDSLIINEETKRILNDPEYKKILYPEKYTWEQTIIFIQQNDLKKAFWYMINLYGYDEKNKELVLKSLITYDKLLLVNDILQSTFFMYAMHDTVLEPNITTKTQTFDPHSSEEKLNNLKEILFYLDKYRSMEVNKTITN
jgi:hypothetical protein